MLSYIWPLALVVLSNTAYHVCAKSMPEGVDPFAALTLTYLTGAAVSALLYFLLNRGQSLIREYAQVNWTAFALGTAIVGLEAGFIYAYKAGWPVSAAQITSSAVLAIALIVIGCAFYREPLSWNKLVGIAVCLAGLALINYQ